MRLPVDQSKVQLLESGCREISMDLAVAKDYSLVPVDNRRYMMFDLPKKKVLEIISDAELFEK